MENNDLQTTEDDDGQMTNVWKKGNRLVIELTFDNGNDERQNVPEIYC